MTLLIAATNRNLVELINQGKFRNDLYERINVFRIKIPPLNERREDIRLIARKKADEFCRQEDLEIDFPRFTDNALELLQNHNWQGNVRQLINVIHRSLVLHTDKRSLDSEDILFDDIYETTMKLENICKLKGKNELKMRDIMTKYAIIVYKNYGKNMKKTSDILGISEYMTQRILKGENVFRGKYGRG